MKAQGGRVVFDIDYRPVLWGLAAKENGEDRFVASAKVTAELQRILPYCDLIVGTEEEVHILGGSTDTVAALREIRAHSDALLVCKRGPRGCAAFPGASVSMARSVSATASATAIATARTRSSARSPPR